MSPLERAARALCLADGLDPDRKFKSSDWSEGTAPHEFAWHEYLPKARAVLEAIREPDPHTQAIAWGFGLCEGGDPLGRSKELAAYQFLIDAALKED